MSIEELLKTLQREYLASLPNKIDMIDAQVTAAATLDLRESFHKLKGTGSTYGLPEVSEMSEIAETICREKPENAVSAARLAVSLLRDIFVSRQNQQAFLLQQDPRLANLQKLLQT